jgi:hypothetical protein
MGGCGKGAQSVWPGSIHPSGEALCFLRYSISVGSRMSSAMAASGSSR